MRYGMTHDEAYDLALGLPGGRESLGGLRFDPAWREARVYEPTNDEGHRVTLLVSRMPAQFWRVVCPGLGLDLGTGSGMGGLATAMAEAIADGCLKPHEEPGQ